MIASRVASFARTKLVTSLSVVVGEIASLLRSRPRRQRRVLKHRRVSAPMRGPVFGVIEMSYIKLIILRC